MACSGRAGQEHAGQGRLRGAVVTDTGGDLFFPGIAHFPYADALESRFVTGGFDELGPATVWTRCRIPIVRGVALTGLQRLLVMVDAANGISASLPMTAWTFVPVDMTVVLQWHAEGEWVGMSAETTIGTDGIGFTDTTLFDAHGLSDGRCRRSLSLPVTGDGTRHYRTALERESEDVRDNLRSARDSTSASWRSHR